MSEEVFGSLTINISFFPHGIRLSPGKIQELKEKVHAAVTDTFPNVSFPAEVWLNAKAEE